MVKFYGEEFTPLLNPKEFVEFPDLNIIGKVTKVLTTGEIVHTFSGVTIGSGATEEKKEADSVYQPNGVVAQYRFFPKDDDIEIVNLRLGGTRYQIWRTESETGKITSWTKHGFQNYSQLSEFWQIEDETLEMDLHNKGDTSISDPELKFIGFKYKIKPLASVPAGEAVKEVYVRFMKESEKSLLSK